MQHPNFHQGQAPASPRGGLQRAAPYAPSSMHGGGLDGGPDSDSQRLKDEMMRILDQQKPLVSFIEQKWTVIIPRV